MGKQQGSTKERSRIEKPGKYDVIIHNDDFTPQDFVVLILMQVFHKPYVEAVTLMLRVHNSDRAVAGSYSLDIAESKARLAMELARQYGYPLLLTVENDLAL